MCDNEPHTPTHTLKQRSAASTMHCRRYESTRGAGSRLSVAKRAPTSHGAGDRPLSVSSPRACSGGQA